MGRLEQRATGIIQFRPEAIPGLLQSEGYARRALAFADVYGQGRRRRAAKARIKRQAILRKPGRGFDFGSGKAHCAGGRVPRADRGTARRPDRRRRALPSALAEHDIPFDW